MRQLGLKVVVLDFSRVPKSVENVVEGRSIESLTQLLTTRNGIVHFHPSDVSFKKAIVFLVSSVILRFFSTRVIITFHSDFKDIGKLRRYARLFGQVSEFVAVAPHVQAKLVATGVDERKIAMIPAFIMPVAEAGGLDRVPDSILLFLCSHHPKIIAYAHELNRQHGSDAYGIDMCIEMCQSTKRDYPNIGLLILIQTIKDSDYLLAVERRITATDLGDSVMISQSQNHELYPLLSLSDLYVRPSRTDGDSVAVREALAFGIPTVASDAVPRPAGTIVFENQNVDAFTSAVKGVLADYKSHQDRTKSLAAEDNYRKMLELYSQVSPEISFEIGRVRSE